VPAFPLGRGSKFLLRTVIFSTIYGHTTMSALASDKRQLN
jgi:hypothetical protein